MPTSKQTTPPESTAQPQTQAESAATEAEHRFDATRLQPGQRVRVIEVHDEFAVHDLTVARATYDIDTAIISLVDSAGAKWELFADEVRPHDADPSQVIANFERRMLLGDVCRDCGTPYGACICNSTTTKGGA